MVYLEEKKMIKIGDNMKKIFSLVLIVFVGLLIVGCSDKGFESSKQIKLESDPLSGYTWEYDVTEVGVIKVYEDNDIDCDEEAKKCDGYQIYKLEGLSEGKTYINFKYSNGTKTLYTAKYEFEVNKKLKIKEVGHTGTYFKR